MGRDFRLIDNRGLRYDPLNLPEDFSMINPVSWEVIGIYNDGFYLIDDLFEGLNRQTLIKVIDNKIVEGFRLQPLKKDEDIL